MPGLPLAVGGPSKKTYGGQRPRLRNVNSTTRPFDQMIPCRSSRSLLFIAATKFRLGALVFCGTLRQALTKVVICEITRTRKKLQENISIASHTLQFAYHLIETTGRLTVGGRIDNLERYPPKPRNRYLFSLRRMTNHQPFELTFALRLETHYTS